VPSIEDALLDERLGPLHQPLYAAVKPGSVAYLLPDQAPDAATAAQLRGHLREALDRVLAGLVLVEGPARPAAGPIEELVLRYGRVLGRPPLPEASRWAWVTQLVPEAVRTAAGEAALRRLRLDRPLLAALGAAGWDKQAARHQVELMLLVASRGRSGLAGDLSALLAAAPARDFIGVHQDGGTVWFSKERFEELREALEKAGEVAVAEVAGLAEPVPSSARTLSAAAARPTPVSVDARTLGQVAASAGCRFEPLLAALASLGGAAPGEPAGGSKQGREPPR
jgi:hypothetical protein